MSIDSPSLQDWLSTTRSNHYWYIKRLSYHDTSQTGEEPPGIHLPNDAVLQLFPVLNGNTTPRPDVTLQACIESHNRPEQEVHVIFHSKYSDANNPKGSEYRITGWKLTDIQTPLHNPSSTGSLCLFAFEEGQPSPLVRVWICRSTKEEEHVENIVGPIYPGERLFGHAREVMGAIPPLPVLEPMKE